MKRTQADNINYAVGWLCGAVFLAAPVAAVVYLLRHRRRPAVQAAMIGAVSLPSIVGARALMLAAGVQHKRVEWIGMNTLMFLVLPLLATAVVMGIPWPRPGGERRASSKARASK